MNMPIEMILVQIAFVLVPVLVVIWIVVTIRRKQWVPLILGLAALVFAAFFMFAAWQHASFYEHSAVFEIAESAAMALRTGKATPVADAFNTFAADRDKDYYETRNRLWTTLRDLVDKKQQDQPIVAPLPRDPQTDHSAGER